MSTRTWLSTLQHSILLWLSLLLFETLFQCFVAGISLGNLSLTGLMLHATLYWVVYALVFHGALIAVTLTFLLLPYLVFALGWVTPWLAILWLPLLAICTWQVYRHTPTATTPAPLRYSCDRLAGFCLVIAWVHFSGAGGIGYQTDDYSMHNGRLQDLVEYPWPVRYSENQNLVFYIGYYLPAAAIGKWLGFAAAYQTMYYWTLLGTAIAFRWVAALTQLRWMISAALLLIFFGGLDVTGHLITHDSGITIKQLLTNPDSDLLDFWMFKPFAYFIGAYPSNAMQLYWAPHQSIAAWIVGALLLHTSFQNSYRSAGFFYALLALWAPLVMLAAAPVFLLLLCCRGSKGLASAFSLESLLGGCSIVALFVVFYFCGSAAENPRAWLWNVIQVQDKWALLLLFYACSWGILSAMLLPAVLAYESPSAKRGFIALIASLLLISFVWYGLFSDMMVRGSALLMFMLMIYAGRTLQLLLENRRWLYITTLSCVLLLSSFSGYWNIVRAWENYGFQRPGVHAPDHPGSSQFLGADDTFFQRHISSKRQQPTSP